jgi:serine protease AprX
VQHEPEDSPTPRAESGGTPELPQTNPQYRPFDPEVLDQSVIAIPLLRILEAEERERRANTSLQPEVHSVIIDLNLVYHAGRDGARQRVKDLVDQALKVRTRHDQVFQGINTFKTDFSDQYVFANLEGAVIRSLVELDSQHESATQHAIYHVWPDFKVRPLMHKSVSTVKADAARVSFAALGEEIVWAVLDSGIDEMHSHFKLNNNLKLPDPLKHRDFTVKGEALEEPCKDKFGHGTHVAGIIAGEDTEEARQQKIVVVTRDRDKDNEIQYKRLELAKISGMAPRCKLLSLKVLDNNGDGEVSNLITALEHVQRINNYGRHIKVQGVNMSVGYEFEPEWFACGQSPLCVEVDRLVRSGVVVVVAAGNTGSGYAQSRFRGQTVMTGMDLTINDPGNAEMAITVGSTHRDMPHVYGVSYFSSKGPTGDGRIKPDLVAPGEKIISCAAGDSRERAKTKTGMDCDYVEDSGTSMAAPHVSGVIAAFLSVRREFIGQPERVKEIFLSTATDLKRDRHFQGHGLVDLMRAIQSV